jgi:head-tail adaptor
VTATGRLRKRVRFEQEVRNPDGAGGYALAWAEVLAVWGGLQLDRGRERVEAGRLAEAAGGVLIVRSSIASRAITPAHRVVIDGVAWNIRSIADPGQRNAELEMVVERGAAT